jgi:UDP-glucose 4-epimerase
MWAVLQALEPNMMGHPDLSQSKPYLVTGGAGFLGLPVVESLAASGACVRVLDTAPCPAAARHARSIEWIQGDLRDRSAIKAAMKGAGIVLHFASSTTPAVTHRRPQVEISDSLLPAIAMLDEALEAGVSRFVFPSSGGTVYGPHVRVPTPETEPCNPVCSHGIVKRAIESYIQLSSREQGLPYTILRCSNPYGPGQRPDRPQGVIAVFASKILLGEEIELFGDGSVIRDFIYIDDVVSAVVKAIHAPAASSQILNVGSGSGISITRIIDAIGQAAGRKPKVRSLPSRVFDVPESVLCIERTKAMLAWTPSTPLDEGLRQTVTWLSHRAKSAFV